VVVGLSQTLFLYYCHVHRVPWLAYYHDYPLEGWAGLPAARRIFLVVNEREYTLDQLRAKAGLTDRAPLVAVAAFEAGGVYLVARE
jgi:hypothetical protein